MAVLGFDLAPFRSAISELQQGVRAGVQEQQAGTGGDYLGYLSGLAPPSQSPAWQALGQAGQHIAPALGGGPSLDFLGQLTAYANQNSGGNSPAFGLLSSISQYGLGGGQAALGGLQKTWDDLNAYGDRLAYNAQQAAASAGQNTGPGSYPKPGPAPSAAPTGGRGTPGAGFGNPTADQVEGLLTGTRLAGQGQAIVQLAQQYGVPVTLAMGILKAESSYSTPAGGTVNNFGGLKNADGSGGFADFPDVRSGLEAVIRNMGSGIYHGLSLQDYLNKYLGGYQGGDPEQYYGNVTSVIRALGGTPDYGSVPVGAPQPPGVAGPVAGGPLSNTATALLGTPYVMGGLRQHPNNPEQGLDCSEFTAWVWGKNGVTLPWNAQQQFNQTQRVTSDQLQAGDLVFFHGTNPADPDYVTHVGIYMGNGMMINAQDGGVMMAALTSPYWQDHLAGYGRVGGR